MTPPSEEQVRQVLAEITYPGFSRDLVSAGVIGRISIDDARLDLRLRLENPGPELRQELEKRIRAAFAEAGLFEEIAIGYGSAAPAELPVFGESPTPAAPEPAPQGPAARNIIGVASGKGGVGKSTVAVNLAVALARRGRRVGFLDADVHGPSAPLMFGLEDARPEKADSQGRPLPLEAHGVRIMSMGFFVERDNAVIWRGPIVGNFIRQLLNDVAWGELDDLIIDFPPGTGDAQLTISQTLKMTGVVIVTTPNELALIDALKAINMFRKVEVPIVGLVENMSHFVCPHCQEATEIYGKGGVDRAAKEHDTEVIGRIPIEPDVVRDSDRGEPVVRARPESKASQAYLEITERVAGSLVDSEAREGGSLGSPFNRRGGA